MSVMSLPRQNAAFVSSRILAHLPFISSVKIELNERNSNRRVLIENYIRDKYDERYAANVLHFLPFLLTLSCNDNLCAVVGIRAAESEPLYLEKYLHYPIEQEIGMRFKTAIERESIIEIGDLVLTGRARSHLLFIFLTDFLFRIDREWVVFTATREVESLLTKMNFTLVHLVDVSEKIPDDENDQWGSYYDKKPRVVFCHIPSAISVFKQNTLMNSSLSLFSNQLAELVDQWNARS